MTACRETHRVQDHLDGLLAPAEAEAFRRHLEGCAACALELAIHRRLLARISALPDFEPDPALTEHIFERILPSRERKRRLVRALGLGYALTLAAIAAGGMWWLAQPGSGDVVTRLSARASGVLLQSIVWSLDAITFGLARVAQGQGVLELMGVKLAPLARVIPTIMSQPALAALAVAASAACVGMLRWMRPRSTRAQRGGGRHVAVLGL